MIPEKKADPGIPNSFIHKDKVLAEMAAEKRQVSQLPELWYHS
jgi:hypothetical protein